jgi:flagellar assembly protein FliH
VAAFVPLLHHFVSVAEPDAPVAPDLDAERDAAYRAGFEAAQQEAGPRIAELERRLAAALPLVDEVARARRAALDRAAEDVAELVTGLAQKVIGDSLTLHPDALPGLIRGALAELPDEDEVWIRVAPDQVDAVRAVVPEPHRGRVVAATEVAVGCVVETRQVSIDATLAAAVEGIAAAAAAWLAGRG